MRTCAEHREDVIGTMADAVTIKKLRKELESLRKKMFVYETRQAEKEIRKHKISGPFRTGEEAVKYCT